MYDTIRCVTLFLMLAAGMTFAAGTEGQDKAELRIERPPLGGDAWPAFRGPSGDGISAATNVPLKWGPNHNIKWRVALPEPGGSSPIVSGEHVYVTCAEDQGRRRSLYCFSRSDGQQLWVRTVTFDKVMPTHTTNPYCASTPLAAGNRVVVWHGSAGLFCYSQDGTELWSRDLGEFRHMWGYGSSPIFYKDRIILNCGPGKRTFVTAIELASGKTLWQTKEPIEGDGDRNESGKYSGSWSTHVIARIGSRRNPSVPGCALRRARNTRRRSGTSGSQSWRSLRRRHHYKSCPPDREPGAWCRHHQLHWR